MLFWHWLQNSARSNMVELLFALIMLQGLQHYKMQSHCNICIDIGKPKSVNKNPVAERAIEKLRLELLRLSPEDRPT